MPAPMREKHPLPITVEMICGWFDHGRSLAAEARRTKSLRLRVMARNHLRGLQQRIAEAMRAE
jgi:hypothetical protein